MADRFRVFPAMMLARGAAVAGCAEPYSGHLDLPAIHDAWEDKVIISVGITRAKESNRWDEAKLLARQSCAKWNRKAGEIVSREPRASSGRFREVLLYHFPCLPK